MISLAAAKPSKTPIAQEPAYNGATLGRSSGKAVSADPVIEAIIDQSVVDDFAIVIASQTCKATGRLARIRSSVSSTKVPSPERWARSEASTAQSWQPVGLIVEQRALTGSRRVLGSGAVVRIDWPPSRDPRRRDFQDPALSSFVAAA